MQVHTDVDVGGDLCCRPTCRGTKCNGWYDPLPNSMYSRHLRVANHHCFEILDCHSHCSLFYSIYLILARFFFFQRSLFFRCEVDALSYICFIQSFISMFNMMLSNHNMCPKRKQRSKNNKSTLTIYIFGGGCMGGVMFSVFMLVFVSFMYGLLNEMRRSLCAWYA